MRRTLLIAWLGIALAALAETAPPADPAQAVTAQPEAAPAAAPETAAQPEAQAAAQPEAAPAAAPETAAQPEAQAAAPAEVPPAAAAQAAAPRPATKGHRSVTILTGSDTSGYNLGSALQFAIGQLFKTIEGFDVELAAYTLGAFTSEETKKAHTTLKTELIALSYLDRERISVFMFDTLKPGEFIVAVNPLLDPGQSQLTTPILEDKLRKTFNEAFAQYKAGKFQYLPGAGSEKGNENYASSDEADLARRKASEAGHLFRELAALSDTPFYLGANLGMARYADAGTTNSVVDLGAFAGYRVAQRWTVEAGLDIFTYGLLSLDTKYQLPLSGKYVFLDASLGFGMVLFQASDNIGVDFAKLSGGFLFGPGITVTVPLLGANLRGGLKFYMGAGSILLGSYGFSYGVSL